MKTAYTHRCVIRCHFNCCRSIALSRTQNILDWNSEKESEREKCTRRSRKNFFSSCVYFKSVSLEFLLFYSRIFLSLFLWCAWAVVAVILCSGRVMFQPLISSYTRTRECLCMCLCSYRTVCWQTRNVYSWFWRTPRHRWIMLCVYGELVLVYAVCAMQRRVCALYEQVYACSCI